MAHTWKWMTNQIWKIYIIDITKLNTGDSMTTGEFNTDRKKILVFADRKGPLKYKNHL